MQDPISSITHFQFGLLSAGKNFLVNLARSFNRIDSNLNLCRVYQILPEVVQLDGPDYSTLALAIESCEY